jgi:hypothetical protein
VSARGNIEQQLLFRNGAGKRVKVILVRYIFGYIFESWSPHSARAGGSFNDLKVFA